jgi:hypothetical protein
VFESPTLTRLRVLRYEGGESYPLPILAENRALRRLRQLICVGRPASSYRAAIDLEDIAAIAHSPWLPRLVQLRLCRSDFGDAGCEEIVTSEILERLERLDLSHGTITDEGAQLLAECPDTNNLKSLDLSFNELTQDGIAVLRARLPRVRLRTFGQHQEGDEEGGNPETFADEME